MDECARRGRWGRSTYRVLRWVASAAAALALAACANSNMGKLASREDAGAAGPRQPARVAKHGHRVKRRETAHARAAPARVHASRKRMGYSAVGLASWYGAGFNGRRTADGETFNMNSLTAAHPTLPLPCNVRVTNLANHRSIVVRVNDRGPYVRHRLIDVSAKTAKLLGFYSHGLAKVKVEYIGRAD